MTLPTKLVGFAIGVLCGGCSTAPRPVAKAASAAVSHTADTAIRRSLACLATDMGIVHAGYARYRPELLKAGIELYELKPSVQPTPHDTSRSYAVGSQATRHTKAYMMDRKALFIGSLNLDPRSVRLNTEMGLVLESPPLAYAYRVERRPSDGRMIWRTRENGTEVVHESEPGVGWWQRIKLFVSGILPVEEQL